MTSLGFSEYAENNNDSTRNGNGNGNGNGNSKIYNRRNGGGGGGGNGNRTLKIPRNIDAGGATPERGLLQSPNGAISGITNENGNNNGMIQQAGKKIKQIKDYIENIHRKGGEDSDDDGGGDMDNNHILPSYPAQGMGVYATNVSNADIIRGVSSNTPPFTGGSETVVRKTTQMNSLHPGSSYSSTLLEGMNVSPTPYFEKVTGIAGAPKKDATASGGRGGSGVGAKDDKTSTYASQYYEQFVPYAESLASQLANNSSAASGGGGGNMSGTNAALIEKLNYIIHMLEEKKEEKTGHVIEELVLYCFLGVFIIFVVDTFTRAANVGRVGGGGRGTFSMFGGGGPRRYSHTASVYQR
jgi:hypothetical protein